MISYLSKAARNVYRRAMPKGTMLYKTGEQLRVNQMSCGRVFTGPYARVETLSKLHRKTCPQCKAAIERGVVSIVVNSSVPKDASDLKQLMASSKGVGELVKV